MPKINVTLTFLNGVGQFQPSSDFPSGEFPDAKTAVEAVLSHSARSARFYEANFSGETYWVFSGEFLNRQDEAEVTQWLNGGKK